MYPARRESAGAAAMRRILREKLYSENVDFIRSLAGRYGKAPLYRVYALEPMQWMGAGFSGAVSGALLRM